MENNQSVKLPDGSGFMIGSFPLPKNHWIYDKVKQSEIYSRDIKGDLPPVLKGIVPVGSEAENKLREEVKQALQSAVRGATMCGEEMDFDPDALIQNAMSNLFRS